MTCKAMPRLTMAFGLFAILMISAVSSGQGTPATQRDKAPGNSEKNSVFDYLLPSNPSL